MSYGIAIHPKCLHEIKKLCKKNAILQQALKDKVNEVVKDPYHFKPLKYDLAGERRVHILKSFVLKYEIDETNKLIRFIFFGHHDEAYKR